MTDSAFAVIDTTMCFLWILTYTLVLIGTRKYRYPLISPITQAIIAPYEFAILLMRIVNGSLNFGYVSLSYLYWTIVEIAIIVVIIKIKFIPKKKVKLYILFVVVLTCIMYYLVATKGKAFFFSYFNTFVGEIFWLHFILRKDYPMKPITLVLFITKFIADAISILTYFGEGSWIIDMLCVMLPILDFAFIIIYVVKKIKEKREKQKE